MKKLKFLFPIAIMAILVFISCDNNKTGKSNGVTDYIQYVPGRAMLGLKGDVKEYEVVDYSGAEWDDDKGTVTGGTPYIRKIYRFDEKGVLSEMQSFDIRQSENEMLASSAKYLYDDKYRITGYERYGSDSIRKGKETYKYDKDKVVIDCFKKDNDFAEGREYTVVMNLDADGRIINQYPSNMDSERLKGISGTSAGGKEYETIAKFDSKDNVIESVEIKKYKNTGDDNLLVRVYSYKKMKITYYDGDAGEGKEVRNESLTAPAYVGQTLSDNSNGIVSAITIDDYTRVGVENNGIDTLKNIPAERKVYKYDKKGVNVETETWRLYNTGNPDESDVYLAQSEEYKYDRKLRKILQITRKYLPPINGQPRELTIRTEEISYDDTNRKAAYVNTLTNRENGTEQLTRDVYDLNEQGYVTGIENAGVSGISNRKDALDDAKGKETWHKNFYEELDKKGNWTKRILSYAVYDSTGKFKERIISDYRTRSISYY